MSLDGCSVFLSLRLMPFTSEALLAGPQASIGKHTPAQRWTATVLCGESCSTPPCVRTCRMALGHSERGNEILWRSYPCEGPSHHPDGRTHLAHFAPGPCWGGLTLISSLYRPVQWGCRRRAGAKEPGRAQRKRVCGGCVRYFGLCSAPPLFEPFLTTAGSRTVSPGM